MDKTKRALITVFGVFAIAVIIISVQNVIANVPTIADIDELPTIIIDPGHGGIDGGAVGVDNIVEKNINLEISLKLRDMFIINGFNVIMIRDTDISIHDEGITSVRKQKTSDLKNRLAISEKYPNAIFLSIHQNQFGNSKNWGAQIFYSPNNPESLKLAEVMQEQFKSGLQPDNNRTYKKAGKELFLMYNAKCTAVLVECGFLSNSQEAHKLLDSEYQSQVAFTIMKSVLTHLELDFNSAGTEEINN